VLNHCKTVLLSDHLVLRVFGLSEFLDPERETNRKLVCHTWNFAKIYIIIQNIKTTFYKNPTKYPRICYYNSMLYIFNIFQSTQVLYQHYCLVSSNFIIISIITMSFGKCQENLDLLAKIKIFLFVSFASYFCKFFRLIIKVTVTDYKKYYVILSWKYLQNLIKSNWILIIFSNS